MTIPAKRRACLTKKLRNGGKSRKEKIDPRLLHPDLPQSVSVSDDEVRQYVERIDAAFTEKNIDDLLSDCRSKVINAIIVPLGLGKIVAIYDKVGGNVDTIHNAREGIYATEKEEKRFEERGEYESGPYHSHPNYRKANKECREQRENGGVEDVYTGQKLEDGHDLDHVKSAKEIHDDPGRVLAELSGPELANSPKNLKPTSAGINRSKKAKSMSEFLDDVAKRKTAIQKQIDNLKSKGELDQNQKIELERLENKKRDLDDLDMEKMREVDEEARRDYEQKVNTAYYTSGKFVVNVCKTSGMEGLKMGAQQAFGLLCYELFNALFDEVVDIWRNGFVDPDSETWVESVKKRLKRVGEKIIDEWRELLASFRDGFFGAIFSNVLTVLVNAFLTTFKNIIRMIREGVYVLIRTAKSIIFPEEGKTLREVLDDALKIFVAGAITVGGVALDEALNQVFTALPFKETLVAIFSGVVTGVSTALAMYALDKLDPFGVKDRKRRELFYAQIRSDEKELLDFQTRMSTFVEGL